MALYNGNFTVQPTEINGQLDGIIDKNVNESTHTACDLIERQAVFTHMRSFRDEAELVFQDSAAEFVFAATIIVDSIVTLSVGDRIEDLWPSDRPYF